MPLTLTVRLGRSPLRYGRLCLVDNAEHEKWYLLMQRYGTWSPGTMARHSSVRYGRWVEGGFTGVLVPVASLPGPRAAAGRPLDKNDN